MRTLLLAAAILAAPACFTAPAEPDIEDQLAGSWRIERTVTAQPGPREPTEEEPEPEPCPVVTTVDGLTITVDPDAEEQVTGSDLTGWIENQALVVSSYETIAGYETLGGATLDLDIETDTLRGEGGVGCGDGCDYDLEVTGTRVTE